VAMGICIIGLGRIDGDGGCFDMSDYFCLTCGGRTGMMGHDERHNDALMARIELMVDYGWKRDAAIRAIGQWQIAERNEPMIYWVNEQRQNAGQDTARAAIAKAMGE